jgi:hypothetical protein
MRTQGNNILTSILDLLKVKHTKDFSTGYFNEHPHKNNMFGLSKMLSDYGIENAGTKIENKEEDIFEIETPFIAHAGGDFVTVYKVDAEKVHFIWRGKDISTPIKQFIESWSGIVLLAEPTENAIEPNYKDHRKKEILNNIQKYGLLFAGGLLLVLAYITNALFTNAGLNFLIILNFIGVYISYLLVLKQLHIHSEYADKICSLLKQHDCNNVLESKAAKLWGVFGWSEIGLGYFIANTLILLFLPQFVVYLAIYRLHFCNFHFGYQYFGSQIKPGTTGKLLAAGD